MIDLEKLSEFLRKANLNTFANENAEKVASLRPGFTDYEFRDGNLTYHDTYFNSPKFIGEEIVYQGDQPIWGMNYRGFTLRDDISGSMYENILRPALMSGSGDNIPLRGPKEFVSGDWRYTFHVDGDMANFIGVEEILHNGEVVCRLYCHGGIIK